MDARLRAESPTDRDPERTMSILRLLALLLVLALTTSACEESLFTSDPLPTVVDEAPPELALGDEGDAGDGGSQDPELACAGDAFLSDPEFARLVCDYQAALIRALGAGVTVDSGLTDAVADAMLQWVVDPAGARQVLADAISQIEALIDAVPTTETVADLVDNLFACVDEASALLQLAQERIDYGGVPIPEMTEWQAAFDEAARLAEAGDVAGATAMVCGLSEEMNAVLVQT